jgi:hypothetical protein
MALEGIHFTPEAVAIQYKEEENKPIFENANVMPIDTV